MRPGSSSPRAATRLTLKKMSDLHELLEALSLYRAARHALLTKVGVPLSNRDPLAEFAEVLVATLVGGTLATSRVQAGWDLETPDGTRYQVKYLANAIDSGVNEHCIRSRPGVDWYALVMIEDFTVAGVVAFPPDLTHVCAALGKKHPRQDDECSLLGLTGLPFATIQSSFANSECRSGFRRTWPTARALVPGGNAVTVASCPTWA